MSELKILDIN